MKREKKAVALPNSDDVTHFNYWYLGIKWAKAPLAVCFRKNDLSKLQSCRVPLTAGVEQGIHFSFY